MPAPMLIAIDVAAPSVFEIVSSAVAEMAIEPPIDVRFTWLAYAFTMLSAVLDALEIPTEAPATPTATAPDPTPADSVDVSDAAIVTPSAAVIVLRSSTLLPTA